MIISKICRQNHDPSAFCEGPDMTGMSAVSKNTGGIASIIQEPLYNPIALLV